MELVGFMGLMINKVGGIMSVEIEMKETLYAIHKMLTLILVEQKKIVEGNAAIFTQVRYLRMMEEQKQRPDDEYCKKCNGKYYLHYTCVQCCHRKSSVTEPDIPVPDFVEALYDPNKACYCSKHGITYAASSGCGKCKQ